MLVKVWEGPKNGGDPFCVGALIVSWNIFGKQHYLMSGTAIVLNPPAYGTRLTKLQQAVSDKACPSLALERDRLI